MSLQDKTNEDRRTHKRLKSSAADAAPSIPKVKFVSVKARIATPKLLVRVVHDVLDAHPDYTPTDHLGDLVDAVKWKLAKLNLAVTEDGYGASGRIYQAVDSALFQRQLSRDGREPAWKREWNERQKAERERRRRRA